MKTSNSSALKTTLKATACAALLASASSAFAQSSVQLYGQVDEWVGSQKFPGGKTAVVVSGGGMSTSYWGLKGSEDLGNGYKAIFALEGFFLAQNGQYGRFTGDTMFSRNAYVGIESPYGTVTAGRLTTPLFVSTILFNPFVDSYVFSPMVYHTYLGLGTFPTYSTDQGVTGDSGWSNAVSVLVAELQRPERDGDVRARQHDGKRREEVERPGAVLPRPVRGDGGVPVRELQQCSGRPGQLRHVGRAGPEEPERRRKSACRTT